MCCCSYASRASSFGCFTEEYESNWNAESSMEGQTRSVYRIPRIVTLLHSRSSLFYSEFGTAFYLCYVLCDDSENSIIIYYFVINF